MLLSSDGPACAPVVFSLCVSFGFGSGQPPLHDHWPWPATMVRRRNLLCPPVLTAFVPLCSAIGARRRGGPARGQVGAATGSPPRRRGLLGVTTCGHRRQWGAFAVAARPGERHAAGPSVGVCFVLWCTRGFLMFLHGPPSSRALPPKSFRFFFCTWFFLGGSLAAPAIGIAGTWTRKCAFYPGAMTPHE